MGKKNMKFTPWKLEDDLTTDELLLGYLSATIEMEDCTPYEVMKAISDVIRIHNDRIKNAKKKESNDSKLRNKLVEILGTIETKLQAA